MTTRVITDERALATLQPGWNELAGERLCHRWEWMSNWWRHLGSGQLVVATVEDSQGRVLGLAPWFKTHVRLQGCRVQSLGCGAACSDYASLLVRPGCEEPVAAALADLIQNDRKTFGDVDLFEWEGHAENDPVMRAFTKALAPSGLRVESEEIGGTWQAPLARSWDEFNGSLSKSFRRKTKKAVQRLGQPDLEVETAETATAIDACWPDFVRLHQARRGSLQQQGCFASPEFDRFLRSACRDLAASGLCRLYVARKSGRALAALLTFEHAGTTYAYQTGAEPELSSLEPGHLIFTWAIQQAIARREQAFDWMRGDEPYKARWGARRVTLCRTRAVPARVLARLRYGLWTSGRQVAQWAGHGTAAAGSGPVSG